MIWEIWGNNVFSLLSLPHHSFDSGLVLVLVWPVCRYRNKISKFLVGFIHTGKPTVSLKRCSMTMSWLKGWFVFSKNCSMSCKINCWGSGETSDNITEEWYYQLSHNLSPIISLPNLNLLCGQMKIKYLIEEVVKAKHPKLYFLADGRDFRTLVWVLNVW